jgi:pilus assembly protein CpaB
MKPAQRNLILLLLVAVMLAIAVRSFLAGRQAQPVAGPVHVLVAAVDLPQGLLLRDSELSWQTLPANAVPPNAILQNSPEARNLTGALLHDPVAKGALVLSNDIISPTAPGFLAAALHPGRRAVSVAINEVSGNAGLIQPGDFVDLLLTQSLHDSRSTAQSVAGETIATNMRVIAVGSTFQRPKDANNTSANVEARTVTLEVTPRAAEVVTVASHMGDLSLALRSFATEDPSDARGPQVVGDHLNLTSSAPANGPVWAGDISQADRAAPAVAQGNVQIIRGSTQSSVTTPTQNITN